MDKMIRRKELLELIGVSSTTQWRMEKAGQFPARVKLGEGSVGWHQVEVEKWLENRERVGHIEAPEGEADQGIRNQLGGGEQRPLEELRTQDGRIAS